MSTKSLHPEYYVKGTDSSVRRQSMSVFNKRSGSLLHGRRQKRCEGCPSRGKCRLRVTTPFHTQARSCWAGRWPSTCRKVWRVLKRQESWVGRSRAIRAVTQEDGKRSSAPRPGCQRSQQLGPKEPQAAAASTPSPGEHARQPSPHGSTPQDTRQHVTPRNRSQAQVFRVATHMKSRKGGAALR